MPTTNLRAAVNNYDWKACASYLLELTLKLDFCITSNIVRGMLVNNYELFEQEVENMDWIIELLEYLKNCDNLDIVKLGKYPFYDEAPDHDNNALINAAIFLNEANIVYINSGLQEAAPVLMDSISSMMSSIRYRFWSQKQPQLEPFWWSDPDTPENMLALLSCSTDPIVNEYMKGIWLSFVDEIDAAIKELGRK